MRWFKRRTSYQARKLLNDLWNHFRKVWLYRGRLLVCFAAIVVLGIQQFLLLKLPQYRSSVAFVLVSLILLWANRKSLLTRAPTRSATISRWIRFPGYLLVSGLIFVCGGVYLHSWSMMAIGAVCYLGWMLGRLCYGNAWRAIAPSWMLLLLVTVPSTASIDTLFGFTAPLIQFASQQLDWQRIFHLIDGEQLVLIHSERTISLDANIFLSNYLLFGLVCCVIAIRRFHLILSICCLVFAMICGAQLVPLRILIAGLVDQSTWANWFYTTQTALSFYAFACCGLLLASMTSLTAFLLTPINHPATKINGSLESRWNHWMSIQIGSFMSSSQSEAPMGRKGRRVLNGTAILGFMENYFKSRRYALLTAGLPAVVAAGYWINRDHNQYSAEARNSLFLLAYEKDFAIQLKQENFEAASLLVNRLNGLSPVNSTYTFYLANALVKTGQNDAGKEAMRNFLVKKPNHSQAHFWLATECLKHDSKSLEGLNEAKQHLVAAIDSDRSNSMAIYTYASLLASRGLNAEAAFELAKIDVGNPAIDLEIARLQHRLGLKSDAVERAVRVANQLGADAPANQSVDSLLLIATAQTLAGDQQKVLSTLEAALLADDGNSRVKESLVQTLLMLCQVDDPEHQSQRLKWIKRAGEILPLHPGLTTYCASLITALDIQLDNQLRDLCRTIVATAIESPDAPAALFVVLGTGSAQKGKFAPAKEFLQSAYDKGDRSSSLLNNLAWVICQSKNSDKQLALSLVNDAIAKDPTSRDALETRAEILVLLGKYKDAIVDLERAYQMGARTIKKAHQLADLYERVGDDATAASYRALH